MDSSDGNCTSPMLRCGRENLAVSGRFNRHVYHGASWHLPSWIQTAQGKRLCCTGVTRTLQWQPPVHNGESNSDSKAASINFRNVVEPPLNPAFPGLIRNVFQRQLYSSSSSPLSLALRPRTGKCFLIWLKIGPIPR